MSATPMENVDNAFVAMMKANAAEPYVHAEYERCSRILNAYIMIYAEGDADYAYAIREAFLDSHESLAYYVLAFGKESLMSMFPA